MKSLLLVILLLTTLLYFPLNRRTPKYSFKIKLDSLLPLLPWTVWIYCSYYLLFPLSIALVWNSQSAIPFLVTQILASAIAALIWAVFPNGVTRPPIEINYNHNHRFLGFIYHYDKDCNGLPSGHVLFSFIACFFLANLYHSIWAVFPTVLLAISFSTLTTKQHYFIDMIITLLLAPLIIELSSLLV